MSEIQSKRDDFEVWLIDMDCVFEQFLPVVEKEMQTSLDYSVDSLKSLEAWIKRHYSSPDEIKACTTHLDGSARYVGEVIRMQLGGKWDIELEDPKDVYFQLPVVAGENYGYECPLSLVTASLTRDDDSFIFTVVNKMTGESRSATSPT